MNFNYSLKSLTNRITPTLKHGVEGFKHPNRIYFKPSDVPTEEFAPDIEQVVTTVAEDATVAPFADRLVHPDLFGLSPAINKEKAAVNSAKHIIKQVKDEKVKDVFGKLYPRILERSTNIPKDSERMTSLMKSVEILDNPKIKDQILFSLDYLSKDTPKKFDRYYDSVMSYAEDYADAANSLRGKYLNIDNHAHNFYKEMDKNNMWLADVLDGTKKSEDKYRNKYVQQPEKTIKYKDYLSSFDKYTSEGYKETYQNNLKQDSMKLFFEDYIDARPEAVKTLYNDEYLKTLPPEISKECKEIQNKYGTYVIDSNHNATPDDIKYIKEELRLWKEAGKDKAVLPKMISVNKLDENVWKNSLAGYAIQPYNYVYTKELLEYDGNPKVSGATLRHEIQHINDFARYPSPNPLINIKNNLQWNYLKLMHGKKWDKELQNGGIFSDFHRHYGMTKRWELKSVTAEADPTKLSDSYKDELNKKFHMQKWIFNLKPNCFIPEKMDKKIGKAVFENKSNTVNVGIF